MLRCFAISLLILAVLPGSVSAADWYVAKGGSNANPCTQPQPCLTIQAAALKPAVADGDTIHVGPGEYASQLLIAKRLTLEGSGSGTTTSFDPARDAFVNAAAAAAPGILMTGGGDPAAAASPGRSGWN
ncbi:MAG: hypothetical protein M3550_01190, partial [Actinomycetota bacterium]|nr:hypothetical protein [Actinomycetota bacterium]